MSTTEKQEKERLRLIEHLSSAHMFAKHLHSSLLNADLWANDEQAPKVKVIYEQAEQLRAQVKDLLAVLKQGEVSDV
jgi:hypothetical protein